MVSILPTSKKVLLQLEYNHARDEIISGGSDGIFVWRLEAIPCELYALGAWRLSLKSCIELYCLGGVLRRGGEQKVSQVMRRFILASRPHGTACGRMKPKLVRECPHCIEHSLVVLRSRSPLCHCFGNPTLGCLFDGFVWDGRNVFSLSDFLCSCCLHIHAHTPVLRL